MVESALCSSRQNRLYDHWQKVIILTLILAYVMKVNAIEM
jgi:hypothetical protein